MTHLSATSTNATPGTGGTTTGAVVTNTREFPAFKLGEEENGMDILQVQKIRLIEPPTRMVIAPIIDMCTLTLQDIAQLMGSAEMGLTAETTL